jgi:hypothetical protein
MSLITQTFTNSLSLIPYSSCERHDRFPFVDFIEADFSFSFQRVQNLHDLHES